MSKSDLPLNEVSIAELYNGEKATYEVPIYQRNYAWGKDEISTLIQDVYDAFTANQSKYYIGTLVSYHRGDQVFEVIDGQQRLTTLYLVLGALNVKIKNKLTYRARKKSSDSIESMPNFDQVEYDEGIKQGYKCAVASLHEIVSNDNTSAFRDYFLNNVHLIHYRVPRDIDLNHYFEIMNSRGEQLEKHEIIKARLMEKLTEKEAAKFAHVWEYCSDMGTYIQQKYQGCGDTVIFGSDLSKFVISDFDAIPEVAVNAAEQSIDNFIAGYEIQTGKNSVEDVQDKFQPIIDFPNFLLTVLKVTCVREKLFDEKKHRLADFKLDDKELIHEFDCVSIDSNFVKKYCFNLLKAKYLLDNYIVHHSNEEDSIANNPWKLQCWQKNDYKGKNKSAAQNLVSDDDGQQSPLQQNLVQLLSMFEVSFTPRQRKNYLFYCLLFLFDSYSKGFDAYELFLRKLADKYFKDVYLADGLNDANTPVPGAFDAAILTGETVNTEICNSSPDFFGVYGNGSTRTKGIPLFIFNYLDYRLWDNYAKELRGEKLKENSEARKAFFSNLGCSDFGQSFFTQFYFSRTRRSLEHYYPQANATGQNGALNQNQINCFGNFAMIGSEANSSGSNWTPAAKVTHYLDNSHKIEPVSVASIKFRIMMQKCKDNSAVRPVGDEWTYADMQEHQNRMVSILMKDDTSISENN